MKSLVTLSAVLLLSACAATKPVEPPPTTTKVEDPANPYPAWLVMKPGYAEACIRGGGCVPMTQAELSALAANVMQRTLQACGRGQSI